MLNWIRILATVGALVAALAFWQAGWLLDAPDAVITWSTESEVETAGFHVYRATDEAGPYERVTEQLIPSSGDPFTGADYQFRDPTVETGTTYFYQLEELETTGTFSRLPDTVRFEARPQPNWLLLLALVGLPLLLWLWPAPARPEAHP